MSITKAGLHYSGDDPGAVKYGNFINYYSFHSTAERINRLHPVMFPTATSKTILCLDIGCNTGELTKQVYEYLSSIVYPTLNIKILGIDIDPTLIKRAKELNDVINVSYITSNITTKSDQDIIQNYLDTNGKQIFDIVFCFSVTMWIHINSGDDGMQDFLKYIASLSRTIIIEPQPWKCYRKAQRRIKKSGSNFPLYETLKIRTNVEEVIEQILLQNNNDKVYESPSSSWDRKIQSFHTNKM